ncbi:serine/threonine protein phosphatase 2B catalytic subunit, putative, partial [Entamoeba invadens IP1]
QEGRLHPLALTAILDRAQTLLRREANIITMDGQTAVFGDIHGQFYDLCNMYQDFNNTKENLLFLGDYVDRGCFGTEVIILLICLKLQFPDRIHLLRGNHECRLMTSYFNFKQECLWKYNTQIYDEFMNTFDCLPLCAIIHSDLGNFFCVHGGISPSMQRLSDISIIDRFQEPPEDGLFCDLLWSDPLDDSLYEAYSRDQQIAFQKEMYEFNSVRGCSYSYGFSAVRRFLVKNDMVCIVRGHEVQKSGCKMNFEGCSSSPVTITIFSAPNYCDVYDNDAAVLMITNEELSFLSYSCVAHPFWLPKFANAFYYTLPILLQNISQIANRVFSAIIFESVETEEDEKGVKEELTPEELDNLTKLEKVMSDPTSRISQNRLVKFAKRRRTYEGFTQALNPSNESPSRTPTQKHEKKENPQNTKVTAREARANKKTITLGLRTDYTDQDKTVFHVEASSRFDLAKKNDSANELRPVDSKDLKLEWQKLNSKHF